MRVGASYLLACLSIAAVADAFVLGSANAGGLAFSRPPALSPVLSSTEASASFRPPLSEAPVAATAAAGFRTPLAPGTRGLSGGFKAGSRLGRVPGLKMTLANPEQGTGEEEEGEKIPMSILSGFLGAGKTTLLKDTLENKGGVKVGIIVNDMASINIDSKLVVAAAQKSGGKMGDFGMDTSDVVELQNGCACCSASDELLDSILKLLVVAAQKNETYDRVIIEMSGVAEPKNVRKQMFEARYNNHPAFNFVELQNMVTVIDSGNFLNLYESRSDMYDRKDLAEEGDGTSFSERKVVDLLTEQVEVADFIVLNKQDLVSASDNTKLNAIVSSLNAQAELIPCKFGKVPLEIVLGSTRESWVANNDDEDDFRVALRAAKGHGHSHDSDCKDEDCKDESHGHSHAKAHSHGGADVCTDPECTDESHGHTHSSSANSNPEEQFGISSFVYSRRRPFHPGRLREVIQQMPVTANSEEEGGVVGEDWMIPTGGKKDVKSPMYNVIRSKGFVWLSNFHRVALYWSHAGQFFDLKEFGMFWASTPLSYWPVEEGQRKAIVGDFGDESTEWGDRRQELVIIGVDLDKTAIEGMLDECLCTDEEMEAYAAEAENQMKDRVRIDFSASPPKPVSLET